MIATVRAPSTTALMDQSASDQHIDGGGGGLLRRPFGLH